MAEGVPTESHATGSQVHPQLRQRMLNRAATFSEGAHTMQPFDRRRSSILSDFTDTRHPLLRPSGNEADKLTPSDEPSFWHFVPLAFAILPAAGGLLFKNGSAVVTDILLLGFGSIFLNWCVRAPWDWYYAAQRLQYADVDEDKYGDANLDEDDGSEGSRQENSAASPEPSPSKPPVEESRSHAHTQTDYQRDASRVLARDEVFALIACFAGPILGAYILHAVRSQLTRPAEGLVSNYNLTIFTMAAELRPVSHVIKMKQARLAHLQRVVRPDTTPRLGLAGAEGLSQRLAEVEARLTEPLISSDVETAKLSATIQQRLQPQLDALNRAVRRYEKRQVAQSIQSEARFNELETRLHDALSLAAAAARTGQRPGFVSMVLTWIVNFVALGFQTIWAMVTYPYGVAAAVASKVRSWFVKSDRQPPKRIKGQGSTQTSMPAARVSSKNGKGHS